MPHVEVALKLVSHLPPTAKNIVLGGVKSVTVQDTVVVSLNDLSSQVYILMCAFSNKVRLISPLCLNQKRNASLQYYLSVQELGKNRAVITCRQLAELNPYVPVNACTTALTPELISQFQVCSRLSGVCDLILYLFYERKLRGHTVMLPISRGPLIHLSCALLFRLWC